MSKIGFVASPPTPWNDPSDDRSIIANLDRLIQRAKASDSSVPFGEWHRLWKGVYEVMGNSEPVEVSDPSRMGPYYLEELIVALGGTSSVILKDVYQLDGVNQYIELLDASEMGPFLFVIKFQCLVGQEQYISGHPTNDSYTKITATGDMEIQINGDTPLITIPAVDVGDVTTLKLLEIGRTNDGTVRVRIEGNTVALLPQYSNNNSRFGIQYIGTDPNLTSFTTGIFCDVQFTNAEGSHFYPIDDVSETISDDGPAPIDGTIVNYNPSGWTQI